MSFEVTEPAILKHQTCPVCNKKTLTLREADIEVPYFGRLYIYSMDCDACGFHKADVESSTKKPPTKCEFRIKNMDDLKVRVVKSSHARIVLKGVGSIEPGIESNGYITNVEGVINRFKNQVQTVIKTQESTKPNDEDSKKARKVLKKINRILAGWDEALLIIEDKTGNSAILSHKAVVKRLKK